MITHMMLALMFACVAAVHALLLALTFGLRAETPEWLVRLLLCGLLFDNTVLAISPMAFGEDWYYALSELRYVFHVFVLPPLAVAVVYLANRAGVRWSMGLPDRLFAVLFALGAIAFGYATEIANLELVPETLFGHTRYVSVHAGLPIATIATNLVVLLVAALIWRRAGWPWLLAGAATIFLVNGAAATSDWGIVAGNIAEVAFVVSWVATLYRLRAN